MRLLMLLLLLFLLTPFAVMLPPDEFVVHSSRYTICMRWPFMYCSDTCCVHFFHAMSLYRGKTFWIIDNFSTRIVIISIEFSLFLSLVMKASNFSSAPIYMQALYSLFIESFSLFFLVHLFRLVENGTSDQLKNLFLLKLISSLNIDLISS